MKNKQEIEKLTAATLHSLDIVQPVEVNEFLHTRIISRMHSNELKARLSQNRLMLKLSVAMGIFICINVGSFYALQHQMPAPEKQAVSGVAAVAEEYSLNNNSYNY